MFAVKYNLQEELGGWIVGHNEGGFESYDSWTEILLFTGILQEYNR